MSSHREPRNRVLGASTSNFQLVADNDIDETRPKNEGPIEDGQQSQVRRRLDRPPRRGGNATTLANPASPQKGRTRPPDHLPQLHRSTHTFLERPNKTMHRRQLHAVRAAKQQQMARLPRSLVEPDEITSDPRANRHPGENTDRLLQRTPNNARRNHQTRPHVRKSKRPGPSPNHRNVQRPGETGDRARHPKNNGARLGTARRRPARIS